jgi:alkylhydroperoxidase family enzyme
MLSGLYAHSCLAEGSSTTPAHVQVLTDEEAWKNLPPVEVGFGQPLPVWIRALAGSLPKSAAAMIDLDYAQRAENPLPPPLRAKLRWIAAHANRCAYGEAYARADYVRAGGKAEDIDHLPDQLAELSEAERLALMLVRQLVEAAYTVTDDQMARLVQLYGEKQVVAIVLVAAYANFQDRLLLALGVSVEKNGPLPPIKVRFHKPPPPDKATEAKEGTAKKEKEGPKRKLTPPAKDPPAVPEKMDDPEWTAVSFEALRGRLAQQIDRQRARVPIPDARTVFDNFPEGLPRPDNEEMRIRWCRLNYGYQPRLTAAWLGGLDVFEGESDLDEVFHESMFWVVTRSLQCFY